VLALLSVFLLLGILREKRSLSEGQFNFIFINWLCAAIRKPMSVSWFGFPLRYRLSPSKYYNIEFKY
ncbi:hypothetical protein, partial [Vibrio casei]|uniref:hypothetical protein n=1 Tax=Vibrio casei TaxID=673372 RepID=UPI003F9C7DC2